VLKQSGPGNPVSTVLQNEPDLLINWYRISEGKYRGKLDRDLDLRKAILVFEHANATARFSRPDEIILENSCGNGRLCDGFGSLNLGVKIFY
jgi:hypothetical protein